MVYRKAHSPAYSRPHCDFCSDRIPSDEDLFYLNLKRASGEDELPSGVDRHEGHLCENCQEDLDLLRGVQTATYRIVGEEVQIIEEKRTGGKEYDRWYTPETAPERYMRILDRVAEKTHYDLIW